MKIIFLDIDGVIATTQCIGKGMGNKWDSYMFDPKCVSVLNYILKETGAEIILSSDWKLHYTLFEMNEIFTHNGVIKGPIGFTPVGTYTNDNLDSGRVSEILSWLDLHAKKPITKGGKDGVYDIKWVAVDDLKMWDLDNFVHCPKQMEGIKQTGIKEKIIKFLE
jgi:hypothetical protein